jgi:fructan beta-fructosidase
MKFIENYFYKTFLALSVFMFAYVGNVSGQLAEKPSPNEISISISKRYLNFPISQKTNRAKMNFEVDGKSISDFIIRLAPSNPDYWVFYDVSSYKGKVLKITYAGNTEGLTKIYQDDQISGQDSLYKESNRPQIHFTSRRGWNNDPNGMIYYEGEYHLFYQHNPFEREWENMSWGHATSKDLIHWEELPVVMVPDKLGYIYSGSAVIDYNNISGFGKKGIPPMIAAYTVDSPDNERQCIAYSLDKGRTFTKYEGNPVIDSKVKWNTKDIRDPKVFWYQPTKSWVMVLFERDGNSIYTSANFKEWHYQSHTTGFWECPQLFELAVDDNKKNTKWVMYGASGTYMLGSFNGKTFTPESGKYYYGNGALYAAQTFDNIPASDGRRIQIGWGRIAQPGMPFNQMMLLPTELTLKTTKEGIRMYSTPVKEVNSLQEKELTFEGTTASEAADFLKQFNDAVSLRIKLTIELSHATDAGLNLNGQSLLRYDMNSNQINGLFYSPEDRTSMEISADIILDKTSVEVFVDGGAFSYASERKAVRSSKDGFKFFGNNIKIKSLKVYPLKSIWGN